MFAKAVGDARVIVETDEEDWVETPPPLTFVEAEHYHIEELKRRRSALRDSNNQTALLPTLYNLIELYQVWDDQGEAARCQKAKQIIDEITAIGADDYDAWTVIGRYQIACSRLTEATQSFQKAKTLCERQLGGDKVEDHDKTSTEVDLVRCTINLGESLRRQCDFREAEKLFKESIAKLEEMKKDDDLNYLAALNNHALVLQELCRYDEAKHIHDRIIRQTTALHGSEHPAVATALNNLGGMYRSMVNHNEALKYYQRSSEMLSNLYGTAHPDTLLARTNVAVVHQALAEYKEADTILTDCLRVAELQLGKDHAIVANILSSQANSLCEQGKTKDCEPLMERAFEIRKTVHGARHRDTISIMNNIGVNHQRASNYQQASLFFTQALSNAEFVFGNDHPVTAQCLSNLSELHWARAEYHQAEQLQLKALGICQNVGNHLAIATSKNGLALVKLRRGEYGKARELSQEAVDTAKNIFGEQHPHVATFLNNLASAYDGLEEFKESKDIYEQVMAIREHVLPPNHPHIAISLTNLGNACMRLDPNLLTAALTYFQRALDIQRKIDPLKERTETISCFNNVGAAHNRLEQYDRALEAFKEAVGLSRKLLPPNHDTAAAAYYNLGQTYLALSQPNNAVEPLEKSLEIRDIILPKDHLDLISSLEGVAEVREQLGDYKGAEETYHKLIERQSLRFGPLHESTLQSTRHLAWMLFRPPETQRSIALLQDIANQVKQRNGSASLSYATSLEHIFILQRRSGDWAEAKKTLALVVPVYEAIMRAGTELPAQARQKLFDFRSVLATNP